MILPSLRNAGRGCFLTQPAIRKHEPIAPLLAVLALAVVVTGCETTRKESCCGSSRK